MRPAKSLLAIVMCFVLGTWTSGCDNSTSPAPTPPPPTPAALLRVAGDGQTGTVGQALSTPVSLKVVDASGNGIRGIAIAWTVAGGVGAASKTADSSDANGVSTVVWTLGPQAGSQTLQATAAGLSAAIFSATANPGPTTKLAFVVQPSDVTAGVALSPAVQVVVQDAFGNTVTSSSASVSAALTSGTGTAGTTLGGTGTRTAAGGIANFADITVDTVGIGYTLTATSAGLASAVSGTFMVSNIATVLAVGIAHTCALASTGAAYCWGENDLGQLGTGDNLGHLIPVAVTGGLKFTALVVGNGHTCGLTTSSGAYCWGWNGSGQLGNGTMTNQKTPTAVIGGLSFASLAGGNYHTCGLTSAGKAYCWGRNDYGQLGDSTAGTGIPVAVAGGLVFARLTAGNTHTCGITNAGQSYCWGDNYYGQLGDGTTTNRPRPVLAGGGLSFTMLSAQSQGQHTCGLTATHQAYCWGANIYGELGDGTTGNRASPVSVAGGQSFAAVAAGAWHTCALTGAGQPYCWGWNVYGELGDGTTTQRTTPTGVVGTLTFSSLSPGSVYTCAMTSAGRVYCWGHNYKGILGDGTAIDRPTPVRVLLF